MTPLHDDHLAHLARALEVDQERTGCWTSPARLLALDPIGPAELVTALAAGTVPWRRLGEGNAYHLLERVLVDPVGTPALALVVHGWAFPPDDPASWVGRPSQHPGRLRARTATVVTPDGRQCTVIRLQRRTDVIVDGGRGGGPLLTALLAAWSCVPAPAPGWTPAPCRRDGGAPTAG